MKILGIADGMVSGAALIEDGRIAAAINEERLIREKMAVNFPLNSIYKVLEVSQTDPSDIDYVAVAQLSSFFSTHPGPWVDWLKPHENYGKRGLDSLTMHLAPVIGNSRISKMAYMKILRLLTYKRLKGIPNLLKKNYGIFCPVKFFDHHYTHACNAYFTSGLKNATVITLDGGGDGASSQVYRVENGKFDKICEISSFNSIGNYYSYVTNICGFAPHKHEGKITGLAAHGKPIYKDLLSSLISYNDGEIVNTGKVLRYSAVKKIKKFLPPDFQIKDLASSMQKHLEEVVVQYCEHWVEKSGFSDLALSGGVFANVRLNQFIHELDNVNSIYIHPAMGDDGLAVGAAFALVAEMDAKSLRVGEKSHLNDVYFGPEYSDDEICEVLESQGLDYVFDQDIEIRIAELLSEGKVVARFTGKMEYGPRTLGNRSILYQPTDPSVMDWLNERLNRTEFMPFAPSTLEEYSRESFKNLNGAEYTAHFMNIAFDCTDWMKETCPAVVHIDGTARPQIVDKRTTPSYHKVIDEYRKITGLPTIINTSFNMHEEPIVCSPYDAARAFKMGAADYLAIGKYLVKKS
uniref:Carbamoyltransferase n=1 Tax=Candidatus Methanogaster sp. ANME-2c ERB4 TaxID=2759911 RepID=A0A7G9Y411_9EURY|nr:hypothetical protein PIKABMHP_00009 [Methanosarcinales archaeon ANME-2c ERB4]QNO42745.1 hypothetical protein BPAOADCO_00009 [Methanosarcinales archaeon ANME-2c ERB4]